MLMNSLLNDPASKVGQESCARAVSLAGEGWCKEAKGMWLSSPLVHLVHLLVLPSAALNELMCRVFEEQLVLVFNGHIMRCTCALFPIEGDGHCLFESPINNFPFLNPSFCSFLTSYTQSLEPTHRASTS